MFSISRRCTGSSSTMRIRSAIALSPPDVPIWVSVEAGALTLHKEHATVRRSLQLLCRPRGDQSSSRPIAHWASNSRRSSAAETLGGVRPDHGRSRPPCGHDGARHAQGGGVQVNWPFGRGRLCIGPLSIPRGRMNDREANRFSARAARYARVGANVGGVAARMAGARLLGFDLDRGKNATELAAALGGLKGPIMKVAQLMATVPDLLPP